MRIDKVELTNFRGLSTQADDQVQPFKSLNFDPSFNVIVGINGIGKTSILDALTILLSRILPRTTPASGSYGYFAETDFRVESKTITARIWLNFNGQDTPYGITKTAGEKRKPTEDINKPLFRTIAAGYDSHNPISKVDAPIAILYTTDRAIVRLPRKIKGEPSGRAAAYNNSLRNRVINYGYVAKWLRKLRVLASESEQDRRLLEVTVTALRRFLPAFGELEAEEDPPKVFVKKGGVRLGIEQLSHGERGLLAMIVDIARCLALANPGLIDPLNNGKGIVFIDELELHLHPKWQRSIVAYLQQTFPLIQFITTTHSPFVIQSLQPGQLINLDPISYSEEYTDKSIEDITEGVMGVPMPQKSERYQRMMEVAEEYYQILARAKGADSDQLELLKQQLDELSIPFSDDPAFTAFLKFQRGNELREHETTQQGGSTP